MGLCLVAGITSALTAGLATSSVQAATPAHHVLADGNAVAQANVPAETAAPPPDAIDPMLHGDGRPVGGVEVHLRVWLKDKAKAEAAVLAAIKEIQRIDRKFSVEGPSSEIRSTNRVADKEEMILSRETYDLVQRALAVSAQTKGAFDPTVQSFDYLWNFKRRPPVRPLDDEIKARLSQIGWQKVVLKPTRAIRLMAPRMRISLAEVEHGHAMARVTDLLQKRGIHSFRLRIGRDVYVRGRTGTRHWYVAVHHPLKPSRDIVQLYLTSHAAATRSASDRFFMKDGRRYHDVLDPRTGKPAEGVLQTTVIGTDAVLVDALSDAVFVLGAKAGIALLNRTPGVEGFVIDAKGNVVGSKGMSNFARLPKSIAL